MKYYIYNTKYYDFYTDLAYIKEIFYAKEFDSYDQALNEMKNKTFSDENEVLVIVDENQAKDLVLIQNIIE